MYAVTTNLLPLPLLSPRLLLPLHRPPRPRPHLAQSLRTYGKFQSACPAGQSHGQE